MKDLPPAYFITHWIQRLNDQSKAIYFNRATKIPDEIKQARDEFDALIGEYNSVVGDYKQNYRPYLDEAYEKHIRGFWSQLESSLAVFELAVRKAQNV